MPSIWLVDGGRAKPARAVRKRQEIDARGRGSKKALVGMMWVWWDGRSFLMRTTTRTPLLHIRLHFTNIKLHRPRSFANLPSSGCEDEQAVRQAVCNHDAIGWKQANEQLIPSRRSIDYSDLRALTSGSPIMAHPWHGPFQFQGPPFSAGQSLPNRQQRPFPNLGYQIPHLPPSYVYIPVPLEHVHWHGIPSLPLPGMAASLPTGVGQGPYNQPAQAYAISHSMSTTYTTTFYTAPSYPIPTSYQNSRYPAPQFQTYPYQTWPNQNPSSNTGSSTTAGQFERQGAPVTASNPIKTRSKSEPLGAGIRKTVNKKNRPLNADQAEFLEEQLVKKENRQYETSKQQEMSLQSAVKIEASDETEQSRHLAEPPVKEEEEDQNVAAKQQEKPTLRTIKIEEVEKAEWSRRPELADKVQRVCDAAQDFGKKY
ncbi:hypothetical protein HDK64DRAFT_315003 [Phyllosticta capitalensis]